MLSRMRRTVEQSNWTCHQPAGQRIVEIAGRGVAAAG